MGKIKRYRNSIERFLSSEKGQSFFNFAYSIGAAIVIWGALFKILYLPGGSVLLAIGMGTEVLMFILTAFDRPYHRPGRDDAVPVAVTASAAPSGVVRQVEAVPSSADLPDLSGEMERLRATASELNKVSAALLEAYKAIADNSGNINSNSRGYVEQMEALNRNVAGLNAIYEIQLKSIGSQLESIERVNEGMKRMRTMYESASSMSGRYCDEAEKMTRNIEQLNVVYENMLRAMTVNMQRSDGTR